MAHIDPYILFSQCNLWRSPNAASELGLYLNKAMANYKYFSADSAGFFRSNYNEEEDNNYVARLSNVGIEVDRDGKVIKRPRKEDLKKFKASYKKAQAQLARDKPGLGTGPASQAFFEH